MKHRWRHSKATNADYCSTCQVSGWDVERDSECLAARHDDPEIDKLYRKRRKAAEDSNESGFKGIDGWRRLEQIQTVLADVNPDGDWYYEGNHYDGRGWRVTRPDGSRRSASGS